MIKTRLYTVSKNSGSGGTIIYKGSSGGSGGNYSAMQ